MSFVLCCFFFFNIMQVVKSSGTVVYRAGTTVESKSKNQWHNNDKFKPPYKIYLKN